MIIFYELRVDDHKSTIVCSIVFELLTIYYLLNVQNIFKKKQINLGGTANTCGLWVCCKKTFYISTNYYILNCRGSNYLWKNTHSGKHEKKSREAPFSKTKSTSTPLFILPGAYHPKIHQPPPFQKCEI